MNRLTFGQAGESSRPYPRGARELATTASFFPTLRLDRALQFRIPVQLIPAGDAFHGASACHV